MKLKEVKYYVKSRPKELEKSTLHFGRLLNCFYILKRTDDVDPTVCGRVKIGLVGK